MNLTKLVEEAESIFVLPDSVTRLKECMENKSACIDDVAALITFDPSLTSQLLKIANSSLYRFPHRIETVAKAIQVIGTQATYDLALSYGVSHTFKSIDNSVIDTDRFWEQSVSCALLAKYLAERKGIREPEKLFVSGLLHNIGELAMVKVAPEIAHRCAQVDKNTSPVDLQRKELGFTYYEFSAALCKDWGLPESIYKPISNIATTELSGLTLNDYIIKLAYGAALDNVKSDVYSHFQHTPDALLNALKLSKSDVEDALDNTNVQIMSVMQLFSPSAFSIF